jgi:hypothetical protein
MFRHPSLLVFSLLVVVMGLASNAKASGRTFRFNHVHPMYFDRAGLDSLEIENLSDSDMLIIVRVPKDTSVFAFQELFGGYAASFGIKAHARRFVHIEYGPRTGYLESALMTAEDQYSKYSDTITLMGRDSAYIKSKDFVVVKPNNRYTYLDQDSHTSVLIKNITKDTIHVQSQFYPASSHFGFGPEGNFWAIPPMDSQRVTLRHWTDYFYGDTTVFRFNGTRVGCIGDTMLLIATPAPGMDMDVTFNPTYVNFGTVAPDSVLCKEVLLQNNADYPVLIDWWTDSTERQYVPDFPALPTELAPHSATPIHFCLKGGSNFGQYLNQTVSFRYLNETHQYQGAANLSGFLRTTNCIQAGEDTTYFSNVLIGDSIDRMVTLQNLTDHDYAISFLLLQQGASDQSIYFVDTATPMPIAAHGAANLHLRYKPTRIATTAEGISALLTPATSECNIWSSDVSGTGVTAGDPTVSDLFPAKKKPLLVRSPRRVQLTRYYFRNNQASDVTVESVDLASGRYYSIRAIEHQALPFVLKPGEYFSVEFAVTTDTNGMYLDTLIVNTKNSLTSNYFPLQAIRTGGIDVLSSVRIPDEESYYQFSIYPNPASSVVHFEFPDAMHSEIEIVDILGNIVATGQAESSWQWERQSVSGSVVPDGNYIVRVTIYRDGMPPLTTSRPLRLK